MKSNLEQLKQIRENLRTAFNTELNSDRYDYSCGEIEVIAEIARDCENLRGWMERLDNHIRNVIEAKETLERAGVWGAPEACADREEIYSPVKLEVINKPVDIRELLDEVVDEQIQ